MNNNLYLKLIQTKMPEEYAKKLSQVLMGLNINIKDLKTSRSDREGEFARVEYRGYDSRVDYDDIYTTWCDMGVDMKGNSFFGGYQVGAFNMKIAYSIYIDGEFEICVHDVSKKALFDTNDALYIITNSENPYLKTPKKELRVYYFDIPTVKRFEDYLSCHNKSISPLNSISIALFKEARVYPTKTWPIIQKEEFNPYLYVGELMQNLRNFTDRVYEEIGKRKQN